MNATAGQGGHFQAPRALADLKRLCALGPRFSGSEGMARQQSLLVEHFKPLADQVQRQDFEASQPSQPGPVALANLVIAWRPDLPRRKLLATHYDTRPRADAEPTLDARPFLGANDGASGVALFMELARTNLAALADRTQTGIDLAFFDAEEYVHDDDRDPYLLGSTEFARTTQAEYLGALVLDMVGGKDASFPIEATSYLRAHALTREVWGLAQRLGCKPFRNEVGLDVLDDHVPLLDAGIPSVLITAGHYEHWHRTSDTPDKCSAQTLAEVATVVAAWLNLGPPLHRPIRPGPQ